MTAKRAKKTPRKKTAGEAAKKEARSAVVDQFTYAGVQVEVTLEGSDERLKVGGRELACARDADTGAYIPDDSPYERHGSLQELARARIDRAGGDQ